MAAKKDAPNVVVIERKARGRKAGTVSAETNARRWALDDLWGNAPRVTLQDQDGKVIAEGAVDMAPVLNIFPRTGHAQIVAGWAKDRGHTVTMVAGQYIAPKV